MACEIISTEGAVFCLWGKPTRADLERVLDRCELIARTAGRPILYVARIPRNAPPPDPAVRAHMNGLMPRFVEVCASYHVVLEGDGFLSAIKRSILASLLQFGWQNGAFFVHENEKTVSSKVARYLLRDVDDILILAEQKGLLKAPPPQDF